MISAAKIRKAVPGDESAIARVHIQSWKEAYQGLMPQTYLDQLDSELEQRTANWKRSLVNPERVVYVAENSSGIIGFVIFAPPRDPNKPGFAEVGAIYLLASEKNKGIGSAMLSAAFRDMKAQGYKHAYCWVLEGNPTVRFYERSGAVFAQQTKDDVIGGKALKELMYEWNQLG